jgi:hypothetical protein
MLAKLSFFSSGVLPVPETSLRKGIIRTANYKNRVISILKLRIVACMVILPCAMKVLNVHQNALGILYALLMISKYLCCYLRNTVSSKRAALSNMISSGMYHECDACNENETRNEKETRNENHTTCNEKQSRTEISNFRT